jgi:hypothetical protein
MRRSIWFGAALCAIISPLAGAQVIDQNVSTDNALIALFSQGDLAQSFEQAASNIDGAGILLWSGTGSTDTVTISLWDKLPNAGGSELASASTTGTHGSWADVFWSPVAVVPNTTYYLVFTGNTTLGIGGDVNNGYSRGQVYANSVYLSSPTLDYAFRTYTGVGAVPEPGSCAMVLAGLGLLGVATMRRKQQAA